MPPEQFRFVVASVLGYSDYFEVKFNRVFSVGLTTYAGKRGMDTLD